MERIYYNRITVKTVFIVGFCLFTSLLFFSCENFLDSSVKDEILNDIYIANHESPEAKVEEPQFADAGVAKDKSIIITFSIPVDPNTFKESFQIINTEGNSLLAHFKSPVWSDNNKKVTITADSNNFIDLHGEKTLDILVKLSKKCKTEDNIPIKSAIEHKYRINDEIANSVCPEASVEGPLFHEEGVAKNKAIVINFSIPVSPESFNNNFEIKDTAGYDLKEHFQTPQWSNNNTVVTIPTIELHPIDLLGAKTRDIVVTLSKNCKTEDNLPLKNAIEHKYRINDDVDNTAPVIDEASYVERPVIKYKDIVITEAAKLVEGAITAESEENICKSNHINTSLSVYIEGSDYGGGAVKGHVIYHRIYDSLGLEVKEEAEDYVINLEKIDDSENSGGSLTLDLSDSQKYQDGMYEIKLSLLDSIGQESSNSFIYNVIRDTKLPYCVTSRFVNDTPYFRDDIDTDNVYIKTFNSQVPTVNKILSFNKHVIIDKISDDLYYSSKLTNKEYGDKQEDLSYFLSWGLSLDNLTDPVKLNGEVNYDLLVSQAVESIKIYTVPDAFISFMKNNESTDIIASVTILDPMGNQNVIYALYPKKIDFYNYVVSDDEDNSGKKKVELNFADIINEKNIPNSSIRSKFRIFYAPLGNLSEDADTSALELKRNVLLPYEDDKYDGNPDSTILKNLEPDSKYVVYIQSIFDADSSLNSQWIGTTFGPLIKVIVDTGKAAGGNIEKPVFEIVKKESAGVNTGLMKITVKVDDTVYNTNKALGVKYVPYFRPEKVFDGRLSLLEGEWSKYEAHSEQEFTFTIKNPIRAPFGFGENWDSNYWDGPVVNGKVQGDYTYVQAVKSCKEHNLEYGTRPAFFKLVAAVNGESVESDEVQYEFEESDDNIPPTLQNDIVLHDSRLSYDGHAFEYENIIREDEGHISEYYNWYYTPYNPAWGDNLSVLSPEEIERLPGGVASYTGSTWLGHNDKDDSKPPKPTPRGAQYNLYMSIPIFGLKDGDYMFFAKVTDTYGNYTYVTLGKAHIGTFQNKLKVELAENKKHFVSSLEISPNELNFDRNMINVQKFNENWDNPEENLWDNHYHFLNELQNCEVKTQDYKTILYNNNNEADNNVFILDDYIAQANDDRLVLNQWKFYKITMQSFNENTLEGYWEDGNAVITKSGVDRIYGRPYNYEYDEAEDKYSTWTRDVLWYVDGETQYDVCTEETVSNTVYYYVPGEDENFNDFYASFFASSAIARSNHSFIVNVIASSTDLGNDIDEWERRGKLIKTHFYSPNKPGDNWVDDDGNIHYVYNAEYDMNANPFDYTMASNDIADSHEKGLIYYVAVAHFADNSAAISDVFTMYGF